VDERPAGYAARGPRRWLRLSVLLRLTRSRTLRVLFVLAMLALFAVALVSQGSTLRREVGHLSAPVLGVAFLLSVAGVLCSLMVWRALLADLGSRLPLRDAFRIMFIGQLAKYIPGSLWPVLGQMELAADRGVPRGRTAVSVMLSSGMMVCTGSLVAVATLPFAVNGRDVRYLWALLVLPVGFTLLSPPVINRMVNLVLRVLRRPPLEHGVSVRGLVESGSWALAAWAANGAMTYVLLGRFAGHRGGVLAVSVGSYALSWVAGFLAIFAPAGAGVREVVMIGTISARTTAGVGLTVALVTRALAVVADAVTGAVAGALVGHGRIMALRARAAEERAADGADPADP
jgi:uncharacterized membrane protein YbhN (UPF0104 family)